MRLCSWMLAVGAMFGGADLDGQSVPKPKANRNAAGGAAGNVTRDAQRFVTFLELPGRRRHATRQLMRIGKPAVPALARGLGHPDPKIVAICVHLLKMIGPDAAAARPALERLAAGKDPLMAHAGRWGLAGIRDLDIVQVCDYGKKRIQEFSTKGILRRTIQLKDTAYDADRLPNGNYLVCYLNKGKVVELDAKNQEVWTFCGCPNPLDADRLPNGNTLIAGGKTKRVIEVDPDGKVVWEWTGTNWPNDADRLPSGNTLICDSPARRIYEVDPAGKIVWSHQPPNGGPIDVERLPNGNTVFAVSSGKGAFEIDFRGKIVREFTDGYPRAILRHVDGTTVVGGNAALIFYDSQGRALWKRVDLGEINAVHRY